MLKRTGRCVDGAARGGERGRAGGLEGVGLSSLLFSEFLMLFYIYLSVLTGRFGVRIMS